MSVLPKLASSLQRNDEVPNQQLALEIVQSEDKAAVQELVENLRNPSKDVQNDCIKVLYEIGAQKPYLIAEYAEAFVKLLQSRHNRMVWGGMTALGTIVDLKAPELWNHIELIIDATENGSVITQDWGIRVLAALNTKGAMYEQLIFPFLIKFLQGCPSKDVPRHAASVVVAVNRENVGEVLAVLEMRKQALTKAQAKRMNQVIKQLRAL
jgi:HEAT repeat protein